MFQSLNIIPEDLVKFYSFVAKSSTNGTPSKKPKLEKWTPDYRWEFEGDKRTWTQYSEALSKILTEAFNKDEKQVKN